MSYSIIDRAVFGPRHAKPRKGLKTAAKGTAIAALLAATGFAGAVLAAMTPAPSPAAFAGQSATAVLTASEQVNWTQRTCGAFTAYQAHPTRRGMQTVVIDSTYLGQGYLKADVGQWEADASSPSPKAAKYTAKDPGYVGQDCGL